MNSYEKRKREISEKDIKRFWNSIEKRGDDECWGWNLCTNTQGYALFSAGGKLHRAQRFAYTYAIAPIGSKLRVVSSCKDKECCNPNHLYTATQFELLQEARAQGRLCVGSKNKASKLNEGIVARIKGDYCRGDKTANYKALAEIHNVSIGCVRDIIIGKTWKHVN